LSLSDPPKFFWQGFSRPWGQLLSSHGSFDYLFHFSFECLLLSSVDPPLTIFGKVAYMFVFSLRYFWFFCFPNLGKPRLVLRSPSETLVLGPGSLAPPFFLPTSFSRFISFFASTWQVCGISICEFSVPLVSHLLFSGRKECPFVSPSFFPLFPLTF